MLTHDKNSRLLWDETETYVVERELHQWTYEREHVGHWASDDVSVLERRLESGSDTSDRGATVEEDVERKQFEEKIGIKER